MSPAARPGSRDLAIRPDDLRLSRQIARHLSHVWQRYANGEFVTYIRETFGDEPSSTPSFNFVYLVDLENGNVDTDSLGSSVKRWRRIGYDWLRVFSFEGKFESVIDGDFFKMRDDLRNLQSEAERPSLRFVARGITAWR